MILFRLLDAFTTFMILVSISGWTDRRMDGYNTFLSDFSISFRWDGGGTS